MGVMREIFGPSKKEIWKQLSLQLENSEYIEGGFFKSDKIIARIKNWIVTLDTYTVSTGQATTTYTRIRAPYVNRDGIRFKIYKSGIFSEMGAALGMQDIEVGSPEFDEAFVIKGNNEEKIKELFKSLQLQKLMLMQSRFHLEVKDDEGWFGTAFPEGVDELYFSIPGILKDIDQLKGLFEIFSEVLDQLCIIGSAYDSYPGVELK